jgi:hypothetical protein
MDIKKKLAHPFALMAQGFGFGALLFFGTAPGEPDASQPSATPQVSAPAPNRDV